MNQNLPPNQTGRPYDDQGSDLSEVLRDPGHDDRGQSLLRQSAQRSATGSRRQCAYAEV